jgi:hypothetical protein
MLQHLPPLPLEVLLALLGFVSYRTVMEHDDTNTQQTPDKFVLL